VAGDEREWLAGFLRWVFALVFRLVVGVDAVIRYCGTQIINIQELAEQISCIGFGKEGGGYKQLRANSKPIQRIDFLNST